MIGRHVCEVANRCSLRSCQGAAPQIAAAARLWDNSGSFLFTSSAGIYAVDDGGQVNEDSAVVRTGVSERNDRCGVGAEAEPLLCCQLAEWCLAVIGSHASRCGEEPVCSATCMRPMTPVLSRPRIVHITSCRRLVPSKVSSWHRALAHSA